MRGRTLHKIFAQLGCLLFPLAPFAVIAQFTLLGGMFLGLLVRRLVEMLTGRQIGRRTHWTDMLTAFLGYSFCFVGFAGSLLGALWLVLWLLGRA